MPAMRLCVVTPYFPPHINACAARLGPLVEEWVKKGNLDIVVITTRSRRKERRNVAAPAGVLPVKIIRRMTLLDNTSAFVLRVIDEFRWGLYTFFKMLFADYDLLYATSPSFFPAFSSILAGKLRRKKCYVEIRDLYPDVAFETAIFNENQWPGKLLKRMERRLYKNCEKIFAVTQGLRQVVDSRSRTPVFLARNGADTGQFYRCRVENGLDENNGFLVVFHGNIGELYDIDFLVSLAAKIRERRIGDIKIHIYGRGRKRAYLKSQIDKYRLDDVVTVFPPVASEFIPRLLHKAAVGIAPLERNQNEKLVFPVKVYECIAAGIAVITTSGSEGAAFVEAHSLGMVVEKHEINRTINYLLHLKTNPMAREEIRKKGIKISKQFDKRAVADMVWQEMMSGETKISD